MGPSREWIQILGLIIGGITFLLLVWVAVKKVGAKENRLEQAEKLLQVTRDAQLLHFKECDKHREEQAAVNQITISTGTEVSEMKKAQAGIRDKVTEIATIIAERLPQRTPLRDQY